MGKDLKGRELGTGIRQRKDGRYEARAVVQGVEISIYGLQLKQLRKDFEKAKEQAKQNVNAKRSNITLNEWFEEWFTKCKVPVITLRTLMLCSVSIFLVASGSACTITRYILPKLLKLEAYKPP